MLINQDDGTFGTKLSFATGDRPNSVAVKDLNGDGRDDVAVVKDWGEGSGVGVYLTTCVP